MNIFKLYCSAQFCVSLAYALVVNICFKSVYLPCNFASTHTTFSVSNNLFLFIFRELCAVWADEERDKVDNLTP